MSKLTHLPQWISRWVFGVAAFALIFTATGLYALALKLAKISDWSIGATPHADPKSP